MEKIRDMRNLGPASEKMLHSVGIKTPEMLRAIGPERAYKSVLESGPVNVSKNLLYALIGAVHDKDWREVALLIKERE